MKDRLMSAVIRLALCPGEFDESQEVCRLCPRRDQPGCAGILKNECMSILKDHQHRSTSNLEVRVSNILHELGMPTHIKGYRYTRAAIVACVGEPEMLEYITGVLYPQVAEMFATTASRVERAIRHAIEVTWDRGDWEILEKYFGNTVSNVKGKPTNGEFISMIVEHLRLENM